MGLLYLGKDIKSYENGQFVCDDPRNSTIAGMLAQDDETLCKWLREINDFLIEQNDSEMANSLLTAFLHVPKFAMFIFYFLQFSDEAEIKHLPSDVEMQSLLCSLKCELPNDQTILSKQEKAEAVAKFLAYLSDNPDKYPKSLTMIMELIQDLDNPTDFFLTQKLQIIKMTKIC